MSIRNSEIPEDMMMQEEFVSIPVSVFEDLIRAETERDILEAVLTGNRKYNADDVMTAIQSAREKHRRGVLHIEIGCCSCAEPEHKPEPEPEPAEEIYPEENQEDAADDEACE